MVYDYTYEELLAFDFGIKTDAKYKGTKIPTLAEVYELFAPTNLTINIEIKTADPAMPAALDALAKEYGIEDRVLYSSFNHEQIARIQRVNPDAFIAPLYSFNMIKAWDYCKNIPAQASHPNKNQISLYPEYVEECHKLGIRVHPWTVNNEDDMRFLVEQGCDALITNYPDIARKVVDGE